MALIAGETTIGQVRLGAQRRADLQNSQFIETDEWNSMIVASQQEFYGLLVQKYGDSYFDATPYEFTTESGVSKYALPPDCFKAICVDYNIDSTGGNPNAWVPLASFNEADLRALATYSNTTAGPYNPPRFRLTNNKIWLAPTPQAGLLLRLRYVLRYTPANDLGVIGLLNVVVGNTVTLNDVTFTCVASGASTNEFNLGGTDGITADNLAASINASELGGLNGILTAVSGTGAPDQFPAAAAYVSVSLTPYTPVTLEWEAGQSTMAVYPPTSFGNLIDGVNGWEEYVLVDAAIKAMVKQDLDPGALMADKQALIRRLEAETENRTIGQGATVSDTLFGTAGDATNGQFNGWGPGPGGFGI